MPHVTRCAGSAGAGNVTGRNLSRAAHHRPHHPGTHLNGYTTDASGGLEDITRSDSSHA
ncbi:hypothetical protein [Microbispora sp. H10885]|uniref:hypothetical protein n=1 Tax=Microbispora sp. H10885 TaxID=2729110 RepID=UPI0016031404|nr:hypothetical protein [Microbispora sp. H10885]